MYKVHIENLENSQFKENTMEFVKPLLFCSFCLFFVETIQVGHRLGRDPYRRSVALQPNGRYDLSWEVDWTKKRITFNVSVATTGYVGFGLARRGKMRGADLIIGGVRSNGEVYFSDRFALGEHLQPLLDPSQDWVLYSAFERKGRTFLSFSRLLDTCDENHDLPITDNLINVIWAYSERDDETQYHFQHRGAYEVYLLDPDFSPEEATLSNALRVPPPINKGWGWDKHDDKRVGEIQVFEMTKAMPLPEIETMYWCSFQKVPTSTKHHIIGFNVNFPSDRDRSHIHHLLVHRCRPPAGIDPDALFSRAAASQGSECFSTERANPLPTQFCRETVHVWGVGGREFFLPEHVGIPMSPEGSEYLVMQLHIDNPQLVTNSNFSVTLEAFYTSKLRQHDASMLGLGDQIPATTSIVIPPSSIDHKTIGLCAPGCTKNWLPPQGVSVVAGWLHTHPTGKTVRFRHVRGKTELPWILNDDNYNFDRQIWRNLKKEVKLLPGDQLLMRCVYDNTLRNGTATVGGFGTSEDMCTGHLYYYPRQPGFSMCRSELRAKPYLDRLQIGGTTWNPVRRQVVVTSPPEFAGLTVREHVNRNLHWNIGMRDALQWDHLNLPQTTICDDMTRGPNLLHGYEELRQYWRKGEFPTLEGNVRAEYESSNPTGIERYKPVAQCTKTAFHF